MLISFPPWHDPQAALKCSYRSDRVTRDWPVALRVRASTDRGAKGAGRACVSVNVHAPNAATLLPPRSSSPFIVPSSLSDQRNFHLRGPRRCHCGSRTALHSPAPTPSSWESEPLRLGFPSFPKKRTAKPGTKTSEFVARFRTKPETRFRTRFYSWTTLSG